MENLTPSDRETLTFMTGYTAWLVQNGYLHNSHQDIGKTACYLVETFLYKEQIIKTDKTLDDTDEPLQDTE